MLSTVLNVVLSTVLNAMPWTVLINVLCIVLQKDELYLNLVLDYVPETVYRVIRHHSKAKQIMPILYTKVHKA